jgi:hypothetical protein
VVCTYVSFRALAAPFLSFLNCLGRLEAFFAVDNLIGELTFQSHIECESSVMRSADSDDWESADSDDWESADSDD